MVEFQILKKKNNLPSKSLNSSLKSSNKIIIQPNVLNQQIFQRINKNDEQLSRKSFFQQNCISARLGQTQPNFRRTSITFNKPKLDEQCDMLRKTTLSFKNMSKKITFFDQFLQCQQLDFKILGQIGKGSFSTVSSGMLTQTHQHLAIKTYQKVTSLDWHRLQNIKREILSLKKIQHQNVVKLYAVIKERNKIMLLMENCGKSTLAGYIRKTKGIDQKTIKRLFLQIINAVKYIHAQGICHRDLKPENVLIDQNNNVKIIDFGFSTTGKNYLTTFCGTPPFMCPQIVLKKPYNGAKADIWALGVLLFLMLNGKLPFKATTEQQLYRLIQGGKFTFSQHFTNQSAKKLINRMLRVQPEQRITAEQIANDKWLKF